MSDKTDDIVERLRERDKLKYMTPCRCGGDHVCIEHADVFEAADTITSLRAKLEKARAALRPFAHFSRIYEPDMVGGNMPRTGSFYECPRLMDGQIVEFTLTVEDLRTAADTLKETDT